MGSERRSAACLDWTPVEVPEPAACGRSGLLTGAVFGAPGGWAEAKESGVPTRRGAGKAPDRDPPLSVAWLWWPRAVPAAPGTLRAPRFPRACPGPAPAARSGRGDGRQPPALPRRRARAARCLAAERGTGRRDLAAIECRLTSRSCAGVSRWWRGPTRCSRPAIPLHRAQGDPDETDHSQRVRSAIRPCPLARAARRAERA